jgi:hypothetical protein
MLKGYFFNVSSFLDVAAKETCYLSGGPIFDCTLGRKSTDHIIDVFVNRHDHASRIMDQLSPEGYYLDYEPPARVCVQYSWRHIDSKMMWTNGDSTISVLCQQKTLEAINWYHPVMLLMS